MRIPHIFVVALVVLAIASSMAQAKTYTFTPNPKDLGGLDHSLYYDWQINWNVPAGQTIVDAVLTIKDINDWTYEPNANQLNIHLLDTPPTNGTKMGSNVWAWNDNEGGGDNWNGKGAFVAKYVDNSTSTVTLSYSLKDLGLLPTLNNYASDGKFGFGFDPDCHYYNDGISLNVKTACTPTPEPSSILVLGGGLTGLVGFAFKRRKTQ